MASRSRRLRSLAIAVGSVCLMELVVDVARLPPYIVPAPSEVGRWLATNWYPALVDFMLTAVEAGSGFVVAALAALATFYLGGGSVVIRRNVLRTAATFQAIPILAVAPFLVNWFGPNMGSKIAAATLICAPVIFAGFFGASETISEDEICFGRRIYPERNRFTRKFLLLRSLPGLFTGLRAAAPLSVLGAIVGEFVGASAGLGFRILSGSYYLRLSEMVAAVLLSVCLSFILLGLVLSAEKRVVFWRAQRI